MLLVNHFKFVFPHSPRPPQDLSREGTLGKTDALLFECVCVHVCVSVQCVYMCECICVYMCACVCVGKVAEMWEKWQRKEKFLFRAPGTWASSLNLTLQEMDRVCLINPLKNIQDKCLVPPTPGRQLMMNAEDELWSAPQFPH
jgi:hypothetical protein